MTLSLSDGRSSLIQSRAFSVNQYLPVRGSTSPPTELRTPSAQISAFPVLGSTRRICETLVGGMPTLKGGPNGRKNQPSLSTAIYFQPWAAYEGISSYTTLPSPSLSRLSSAF